MKLFAKPRAKKDIVFHASAAGWNFAYYSQPYQFNPSQFVCLANHFSVMKQCGGFCHGSAMFRCKYHTYDIGTEEFVCEHPCANTAVLAIPAI